MYRTIYRYRNFWRRKASVCVIITNYNYAHFILDCLASLVEQRIDNFDLVVVDDYSSDDSLEVISRWLIANRRRFRKISLLAMNYNVGPAIARNVGIRSTSCKYCFMLDADNILFPNCLHMLTDALENSSAVFAYPISSKFGGMKECLSFLPWDLERMKKGNYIDTMAMVRKSWLEKIDFYSDNSCTRLGWEDYDLWIKTALHGGAGILVPQIMAKYRVHSSSRSFTTQNPNQKFLMQTLKEEYPEFWEMES